LVEHRRAPLGVFKDILEAVMDAGIEGMIISKISRKANLSHDAAILNCQKLTEAGLLQSLRIRRNYIFMITEKGIRFFHEFQKFHDTIKELNVRY
jgi:predicted transcriptional regulator